RAIVEATSLPAMVYDIPGRTGVAIGDDCLDRLAAVEQIKAIKDATGDVPQGFDRMRRTGLDFCSGDDALNLAWLVHGASGVVSVVGHVVAAQYRKMVQAIDERDLDTARDLSAQLSPVVEGIMGGGQGAVMAKAAEIGRASCRERVLSTAVAGSSKKKRDKSAADREATRQWETKPRTRVIRNNTHR